MKTKTTTTDRPKRFRKTPYDYWFKKFQPLKNKIIQGEEAPYDGCMFETYGAELDHIRHVAALCNQTKIWTLLDCDGKLCIAPGFHFVNRIGYFITKHPCDNLDITVNAE